MHGANMKIETWTSAADPAKRWENSIPLTTCMCTEQQP